MLITYAEVNLAFPVIKLSDYRQRWEALATSANPFAVVVMTHLQAKATRQQPKQRLDWKLKLIKGLYERGFERQAILNLF